MNKTIIARISALLQARDNCAVTGNVAWFMAHTDKLHEIERNKLPNGSGIDSGTKIDLDSSTPRRVVLTFSFHHMNEGGYYDVWTHHTAIVTPEFDGFYVRITGRDRNDIKEYLGETFQYVLGLPESTS